MFAEDEKITNKQKYQIIDAFEEVLFVGLNKEQYDILWVEHIDKGRLELNFVVPRIELHSGNDLDLYSHKRDLALFDMWKNGINKHYKLADPNDPSRARTISERTKSARASGTIVANRRTLDETLHELVSKGDIKNRKQMLELLEQSGYEITRCNNESISIKHDDIGKKALRLKGGIYSESFTSLGNIERIGEEREQRVGEYDSPAPRREVGEYRRIYQSYLQTRAERHKKRYKRIRRDFKEESQIIKKRDSNDLDATNNAKIQRRHIDDGIRKHIEKSYAKRTERAREFRERENALFEQIKVSNNQLSISYGRAAKELLNDIETKRNNVEKNITRDAERINGKIISTNQQNRNYASRVYEHFERVKQEFSNLAKSIKGVIDEVKKLKLFKQAQQEIMSSDRPTITLTPRR